MTFNILLSGGIGTKILRLIAGYGEAISKNIAPQDICLIEKFYPKGTSNHAGVLYEYHNTQDIFDYVRASFGSYERNRDTSSLIKYDHDQHMANMILIFVTSPLRSKYLTVRSPRNPIDETEICSMWVRGKDRPSNIDIFTQLVLMLEKKQNIRVLSNDKQFVLKSPDLFKHFSSTTSLNDYHLLLNSSSIYTQMSGFTLSPFLLSASPQKLVLLDKSHHSPFDYPFLNKDWDFYMYLVNQMSNLCPNKSIKLLK